MFVHTSNHDTTNFFSDKYLQLNSCGNQICNGNDFVVSRPNGRHDYLLLYIRSGKCTAIYDNKTYTLRPGNFVHYPPDVEHRYIFHKEYPCESLWIHYVGKNISEILEDLNLKGGVYNCPPSSKVMSIFNEIILEYQLKRPMYQTATNALIMQLLTTIARHSSNIQVEHTSAIENVIVEMNERIAEPYDADVYAKLCTLSKSRFAHKFKDDTGLSPLQYFLNLKFEKAKELIAFSDLNITEIALQIGYDNPLYFSRHFKKHTGMSPSEYRNSITHE